MYNNIKEAFLVPGRLFSYVAAKHSDADDVLLKFVHGETIAH
jgi:hypothetical protein